MHRDVLAARLSREGGPGQRLSDGTLPSRSDSSIRSLDASRPPGSGPVPPARDSARPRFASTPSPSWSG
jgi:hypothetical protein